MSYPAIRDALNSILSTAPLTDSHEVRNDDWSGRNRGQSAVNIVIRRGGPAEAIYQMGGYRETRWQVVVEIWRRYRGYPDTANSLHADMGTVRDEIDKNRLLGGIVTDAFVRQIEEPQEIALPGEVSPAWLRQDLIVEVAEEDSVTLQE